MKLHIIVVRDSAADVYGQPQFVPSIGGAVRSFTDEVNSTDSASFISKHPSDFTLFHIGTYDDANASFELLEHARQLARGVDVKVKP